MPPFLAFLRSASTARFTACLSSFMMTARREERCHARFQPRRTEPYIPRECANRHSEVFFQGQKSPNKLASEGEPTVLFRLEQKLGTPLPVGFRRQSTQARNVPEQGGGGARRADSCGRRIGIQLVAVDTWSGVEGKFFVKHR